ncbi:MAG TPA: O-acetylhomoserine aminocarboxypropyltransferase/cysteine synthase, partial [Actinomyces sp.]|nr:O-acetylhomoserine aminocarboxypropyltransferase/cysteine synthase [Actinomyces sp.]
MSENWAFETKQIHAARQSDPVTGATAVPIYQSTSFEFPSVEEARDRFQVKKLGPIYTRLGNPTNDAVEGRISALEGGVGALFTASGQAAQTLAILNLAS